MACRKAPKYVAIKSIRRAMVFYKSKVVLSPSNPACWPRPVRLVARRRESSSHNNFNNNNKKTQTMNNYNNNNTRWALTGKNI